MLTFRNGFGRRKKNAKISVDRRKRRLEKQQVFLANSLLSNERSQRRADREESLRGVHYKC